MRGAPVFVFIHVQVRIIIFMRRRWQLILIAIFFNHFASFLDFAKFIFIFAGISINQIIGDGFWQQSADLIIGLAVFLHNV